MLDNKPQYHCYATKLVKKKWPELVHNEVFKNWLENQIQLYFVDDCDNYIGFKNDLENLIIENINSGTFIDAFQYNDAKLPGFED